VLATRQWTRVCSHLPLRVDVDVASGIESEWQANDEGASFALPTLHADRTAMLLDNLVRYRHANTSSGDGRRYVTATLEPFEDAPKVAGRNAQTMITDGEHGPIAGVALLAP
jgi:hypothetical protein